MLNKELLMMTSGEKASAKIAIQTYVSAHVILQNGEDIHLQGKPSVVKEATYNNRDVVYIECLRRGGLCLQCYKLKARLSRPESSIYYRRPTEGIRANPVFERLATLGEALYVK